MSRRSAPVISGAALCGPSIDNFDLEEHAIDLPVQPLAIDVQTIARTLWNSRPRDLLTNSSSYGFSASDVIADTSQLLAWYATVNAFAATLGELQPGIELTEFFDTAGVPS